MNQNSDDNNLYVCIYVKIAYQITCANYYLSRNLTLNQMLEFLKASILSEFNVSESQYELVEAGQNLPEGVPSEEGNAFLISSNIPSYTTIHNYFNKNHVAFYIRMFQNNSLDDESTELNTASSSDNDDPICMVCHESEETLTTYFGCSHYICDACCAGCINAGINCCGVCRHER